MKDFLKNICENVEMIEVNMIINYLNMYGNVVHSYQRLLT